MSREIFRTPGNPRLPFIQRFIVKSTATGYSTCRTYDKDDAEGTVDVEVANAYGTDRSTDDVIYAIMAPHGGTGVSDAPVWLDFCPAPGGAGAVYNCEAATTANHGLSGTSNVDGAAISAGEKVLAWKQTTASQNGVYTVAAGAWTKVTGFAAGDATLVWVAAGTANGQLIFGVTANNTVKANAAVYK